MAPARVPWGLISTKIPKSHVSPSHLCGPFLGGPPPQPSVASIETDPGIPALPGPHQNVLQPTQLCASLPNALHSAFVPRLVVVQLPGHSLASCLPLPSPGTLHLLFRLPDGASGHRYALGTLVVEDLLWLPSAHSKKSPPLRLRCLRPGHIWVCALPAWPTAWPRLRAFLPIRPLPGILIPTFLPPHL